MSSVSADAGAQSDRPVRVAVIGVGHLGKFHAKIYAANPRAELVCVVDPSLERAQPIADECKCTALTDLGALPKSVEAVSIAVPTSLHAEVAIPLLERGVHCLVEKPLAASVAEADKILAAAKRGRALLSVGHVERFQPGLRKVREMNVRPRFIECHRLAPFSFRSMDVGVVHDLMIHDLDLILDMVGSEVESLDAAGGTILTEREDVASVRLVFKNGARANVTASRASLAPMRRFRLFSSAGYVSLDFTKNYGLMITKGPEFDSGRAKLRDLDFSALAAQQDWITSRVLSVVELDLSGSERPLQAELDSFLRCVQTKTQPEVTGEDGRDALELADRIAREIHAQRW